jgi:hypothetical protein
VSRKLTEADILMWEHLEELGDTQDLILAKEYVFCPNRLWRFDFVISPFIKKIAIEIDGGVWSNGRHNRGSGYVKELEKFNMATLLGWRVLHFLPSQVLDGSAISFIKRVLEAA